MKGIGDINTDLPSAHSICHLLHNQPLSIHEPNTLMSPPCYFPVSDMPSRLPDTMVPKNHHINAAILDKYVRSTAASIKKRCKAFLHADGGNFGHLSTSMHRVNRVNC